MIAKIVAILVPFGVWNSMYFFTALNPVSFSWVTLRTYTMRYGITIRSLYNMYVYILENNMRWIRYDNRTRVCRFSRTRNKIEIKYYVRLKYVSK